MSELCRFRGAKIMLYQGDHAPPHFHVRHGNRWMRVGITPVSILSGSLPRHIERLVLEWARVRQQELLAAWDRMQSDEPPGKIAPLD